MLRTIRHDGTKILILLALAILFVSWFIALSQFLRPKHPAFTSYLSLSVSREPVSAC